MQNVESPWCLDLAVDPIGVRRARHLAAEFARHEHLDDFSEALVLVTSELVSNAIRHADSAVTVKLIRRGPSIRVEVVDDGAGLPQVRSPRATTASGRGLLIIDGLASEWGSSRVGGGKVVWAELSGARSPSSGRPAAMERPSGRPLGHARTTGAGSRSTGEHRSWSPTGSRRPRHGRARCPK